MKLYDYLPSGNSYKVRWLLSYLGLSYTHIPIDIHKRETHTPEFLNKNPAGQIPLLELEDGRLLAESNAILTFLAEGSDLIPDDAFERAKMMQWMFWEQYRHEPAIAVARFIRNYAMDSRSDELPALMTKGEAVLNIMDDHLSERDWFVGTSRSLADIALYAYTHVADEAGFDLSQFSSIKAWLARFEAINVHICMGDIPL
ncbi:glutathione S-transferase [Litorimonas taeanensis]|uniref:Glutathione S-transferase n=1 Tax=Litorimonas taeanensis TaxID=568099 RepID=A0A420WEY2_9PROT|nr:glutathione S-transferase family protein [Litorimonas taeanensis]RKQ69529.1 glutathione S-transferase [Litorimonas taeanensis]